MRRDSLTTSFFSVSFPTSESDNKISLLSSILLLSFSSLFPKTLICNPKSHQPQISAGDSTPVEDFTLPDDSWVEILCRLPPKDILRLKLVSKSWNSLISDVCIPKITAPLYGFFVISPSPRPARWDFACCVEGTGIHNNGISFVESCFRMLPFTRHEYFLDSCNGFLLFFKPCCSHFYICNPSTGQYLALPRAPELQIPRVGDVYLTFTPHANVVWLRFDPLQMIVYSSETGKWVVHTGFHLRRSICEARFTSHGVFVDGYIFFLSSSGRLVGLDPKQIQTASVRLPKIVKVRGSRNIGCIGVSKNCLHYAWDDPCTHRLFVWRLNEREWVLKHSFSLLDLAKYSVPGICEDFKLLAPYSFHPTSDVIFLGHKTAIFRYDPTFKKLDCVYRLTNGKSIKGGQIMIYPFMQSLATISGWSTKRKQRGKKKDGQQH